MTLKQTSVLLKRYGKQLISGAISDDELRELMHRDSFPKSNGYANPQKPVTDLNHSQQDAINDFILAIGPKLKPAILHDLTRRMIGLADQGSENTFMRTSTLEKAFLAYEMSKYPLAVEEHFASRRFKAEFKSGNDIENLLTVILGPIIKLYQLKTINTYYPYAVDSVAQGRSHFFSIKGANFNGLRGDFRALSGDHLKSRILINFKDELAQISTLEDIQPFVDDFKLKPEYAVLKTGQGLVTQMFKLDTSSVKAFHEIVKERVRELKEGNNPQFK